MLFLLLLAAGLADGQNTPAPTAGGPGLEELKKQFEAAFRDLQRQEQEAAKLFRQRYLAGLATLEESLQSAGNQLTAVLAVHGEITRFEQSGDIPDSVLADNLPALRKLQDAWRAQMTTLPLARAQKIVAATERYLQNLATLQKALTAKGDTGGVEAVKVEKDRLLSDNQVREALALAQSRQTSVGPRATVAAASVVPSTVPSDAVRFKNRWFRIYEEDIGWLAAKLKCERLGGHLAVIPDEATWDFLHDLIKDKNLWLGASEHGHKGKWTWVDGTDMSFVLWASGQPDNMGGKLDCLFTWASKLGDCPEAGAEHGQRFVHGYVCEWGKK